MNVFLLNTRPDSVSLPMWKTTVKDELQKMRNYCSVITEEVQRKFNEILKIQASYRVYKKDETGGLLNPI
jgi:hypothetical protein